MRSSPALCFARRRAKLVQPLASLLAMCVAMLCAPTAAASESGRGLQAPVEFTEASLEPEKLPSGNAPHPLDEFPDSRLARIYNDNVVVMLVDEDVGTRDVLRALAAYTSDFYRWFEDHFDYLFFVSNGDSDEFAHSFGYYGMYIPVMNDTKGIGQPTFRKDRFGSSQRLRGLIHFSILRALRRGPSLHELQHAWANFAVPTVVNAHWGFSSADGQLGGFDIANLVELGDGKWTAGGFGIVANGGNGVPYSLIELYFAGLVPPEEVPDLWVAQDGKWLEEDGETVRANNGDPIFTAQNVRTYSIADIIAEHGSRNPPMSEHPHQRAAVILLTDAARQPSEENLQRLSEHAAWLGLQGDDGSDFYNFYEATGGRGSLTLDGLSEFRRGAARPRPPTLTKPEKIPPPQPLTPISIQENE